MAVEPGQSRSYHDGLDEVPPPAASTALIGHQGTIDDVRAIIAGGHHAILLEGEEGIGKATAAFHLANAMLSGTMASSGPLPPPTSDGQTYRQIVQGGHPNLLHLTRPPAATGSGFRTVITVDEVRRVGHFLAMTPGVDAPRIVIVDPVGDMQRAAANALLKTLEEPPANTVFFLIAHGSNGVLPTIRSRCQHVRFLPLPDADVARVLERVAPQAAQSSDLDTLVALAGGSPRRAMVMALYGGVELRENLDALMAGARFDTTLAHKLADVAGARGNDMHDMLLKQMMADQLHRRARDAALTGATARAARLADFATDLSQGQRVAAGFGLDRRQAFLVDAARMHALLGEIGTT